jgi:hypothetical protein
MCMTKSQLARLDALRRAQDFLDTNAVALGSVSKSTSRTDLDAAVTTLVTDGAAQDQAATEATSRTKMKNIAREELRLHHMQPIAMIARKKLAGAPAMQDLKLPAKNTSDAALVLKGKAMATAAAQYTQLFVDQQLPADFIDQLLAAVQSVLDSVTARVNALAVLHAATTNVKDQLTVTHTDVKVLNALVVKQLKGQTGLLNAWRLAKRVKVKPGTPAGTTPPASTPPASTPPASTPPASTPPASTPPASTPPVTAVTAASVSAPTAAAA